MRLLGLEITRSKAATPTQPVSTWGSGWGGGWLNVVREPFAGAWQRNMEIRSESVLTYSAVFACITLIASDVAKICLRLVQKDDDGIWNEVEVSAFSPVLRKPNRYQNRIKFIEQWITSKLIHGNTYVLKERDSRKVVVALYVLDPCRTKAVVSPDGSIYYQLNTDNLAGIDESSLFVPASEIIHDTMVCLYHPLCGVSPITACGLAAMQGLAIQRNSTHLFENGVRPGGIVTAPGDIPDTKAKELKDYWEANYTGSNAGRIAVLGGGLSFEPHVMNAVDAQLIDQLKWTAETVCSAFHVPPYMIGVGTMPTYNNIEALNQQYYAQCLQSIIENIELCLDEGLGLAPDKIDGKTYGTEFDLDDLLRMDTATLFKTVGDGVGAAILTPNEGRKRLNKPPLDGGDTVYMQQQDYSLEALAKRDKKDDPFASAKQPATQPMLPAPDDPASPPAKSIASDDVDAASTAQLAAWELKSQLDLLAA